MSYEIAAYTALNRFNLKEDFVYDACLCHGASGIAHFFHNCSSYYNDKTFEKAYLYWRNIVISMYDCIDGEYMFGNFRLNDGRKHKNLSILEGDAGVGLMLMNEFPLLDNLLLYKY